MTIWLRFRLLDWLRDRDSSADDFSYILIVIELFIPNTFFKYCRWSRLEVSFSSLNGCEFLIWKIICSAGQLLSISIEDRSTVWES